MNSTVLICISTLPRPLSSLLRQLHLLFLFFFFLGGGGLQRHLSHLSQIVLNLRYFQFLHVCTLALQLKSLHFHMISDHPGPPFSLFLFSSFIELASFPVFAVIDCAHFPNVTSYILLRKLLGICFPILTSTFHPTKVLTPFPVRYPNKHQSPTSKNQTTF